MEKYVQINNETIVTILDDTDSRYQAIVNSVAINSYQKIEISDELYNSYKDGSILQYVDGVISVENKTLEQAIQEKILEIEQYDSSSSVNSFNVNSNSVWLDKDTRSNYNTSIQAAELLGETEISLLISNLSVTLTIQQAKIMLAQIQRYADACYLVTQSHIAAVKTLTVITEIDAYDIENGYPDKLTFTI